MSLDLARAQAILVGHNGGRLSGWADIELRLDSTVVQVLQKVPLAATCWPGKVLAYEAPTGPSNPHPLA